MLASREATRIMITSHRFINSVTLETRFVSPRLGLADMDNRYHDARTQSIYIYIYIISLPSENIRTKVSNRSSSCTTFFSLDYSLLPFSNDIQVQVLIFSQTTWPFRSIIPCSKLLNYNLIRVKDRLLARIQEFFSFHRKRIFAERCFWLWFIEILRFRIPPRWGNFPHAFLPILSRSSLYIHAKKYLNYLWQLSNEYNSFFFPPSSLLFHPVLHFLIPQKFLFSFFHH